MPASRCSILARISHRGHGLRSAYLPRSAPGAGDEFNAEGGILGKQIRAVTADTKTDIVQGAKAGADVVAQRAQFMIVSCDYDMGAPSATVANSQFRSAGIDVPIGGGDSMDGDYWAEAVPGLSDHYASAFGSIWGDDPRPEVNEIFERYAAKLGAPAETSFPLNGYSAIQMIKIAAERAGSWRSGYSSAVGVVR